MIKFIVDDLADYTADLLDYSSYICYLPKKILLDNDYVETKTDYDYNMFGLRVEPSQMPTTRYRSLLESFLDKTEDDFVYFKPYTFGLFDSDINNLSLIIENINLLNNNRIHVFETSHFCSSLHFIVSKVIEKYKNENSTIEELQAYCESLNNNIYSYISFYSDEKANNTKWLSDTIEEERSLFKLQNKSANFISLADVSSINSFYESCVGFVVDDLNSKENEYDLLMASYPIQQKNIDNKQTFINLLTNHKNSDYLLYEKSQSNVAIGYDGDFISIYSK